MNTFVVFVFLFFPQLIYAPEIIIISFQILILYRLASNEIYDKKCTKCHLLTSKHLFSNCAYHIISRHFFLWFNMCMSNILNDHNNNITTIVHLIQYCDTKKIQILIINTNWSIFFLLSNVNRENFQTFDWDWLLHKDGMDL